MTIKIEKILAFHCPSWDELPKQSMFNQEVVEYIQDCLGPIMNDEVAMTSTMIQNYSKWGVIPKIKGRKYGRQQIAFLLIIAIYKRILPIETVRRGIELQTKRVTIEEGFDLFSESINNAVQRVFKTVGQNRPFVVEGIEISKKTEGINAVSHAFATKLLAELIIESGGYDQIGDYNE
ncbi:DUF1836 domain-containing protein [Facklamia sp. P12945]|uniref:DUF1836 domain-containing protein n=1 Tax=unclassified Facklamia TaxID=2622293 RepID=UPI003D17972B